METPLLLPVLACVAIVLDFPHQPGRLSGPGLLFEFVVYYKKLYFVINIIINYHYKMQTVFASIIKFNT